MKKKLLLALTSLMCMCVCVCICACGGNESSTDLGEDITEDESDKNTLEQYDIGEVIETDMFKYTLTDLEFVDGIKCDEGDDFFTPNTEGTNVLNGGEGYKLLYFSFEYEYIGKSSLNSSYLEDSAFVPAVVYKDYDINSNYFVFWREVGDNWYNLASDVSWTARENMGLAYSDLMYTYEPLTDKKYEVHGTISVPIKAFEDNETEMSIHFQLLTKEENNNYKYDLYNFKVR